MVLVTHATIEDSNIAAPVVFSGAEADEFLRDLPAALPPETIAHIHAEIAEAAAALSPEPANAFFK